MLGEYNVKISMTENGDPRENAIAERVNGILKVEMGLGESFTSHQAALEAVDKEIHIYNSMRPHASCDYLTPNEAHTKKGKLKMRWKSRSFEKKNASKEVYTSLEEK